MKILKYLAIETTISEAKYNKLVKLIHNLILPRCWIYRNIPLVLKYSLREVMGLRLRNLFYTQGITKLILFMEENNADLLIIPLN
jgi:hypothetical protein